MITWRVHRRRPTTRWRALLPSLVMGVVLFVGYFVLPFTSRLTANTVLLLAFGLVAVAGLLIWQIQAIRGSPMPLARAIGTLTVSLPLFLIVFSITYYVMAAAQPSSWSEPIDRLDALYFTLTTFATVGFGDIVPVSTAARTVVVVQIAGDLLVVGVIARVVVEAIREGLAGRKESQDIEKPDSRRSE